MKTFAFRFLDGSSSFTEQLAFATGTCLAAAARTIRTLHKGCVVVEGIELLGSSYSAGVELHAE